MIKSIYFEQIQVTQTSPGLDIRPHNVKAYLDIAKDIDVRKNGLFSFVLKCDRSDIIDYSVIENVSPKWDD